MQARACLRYRYMGQVTVGHEQIIGIIQCIIWCLQQPLEFIWMSIAIDTWGALLMAGFMLRALALGGKSPELMLTLPLIDIH